jgi:acetyl esterase
MPLLPQLEPMLAALNAPQPSEASLTVAERRAQLDEITRASFTSLTVPGPDMADERTHHVDVAGGTIRVRTYRAVDGDGLPVHLHVHGGGWWLGNIDLYDDQCRNTAAAIGGVVVSVGYRLAPEHSFPTAIEDAYAGLCWTVEHAADLGADPARLTVGGASAGGNLAAALCLMARDRNGPSIRGQYLQIPATDLTLSCPSIETNGSGYMLTRSGMEECREFYTPDPADHTNPYASPLLAPDLHGLPPALIITAEYDPLRDEGEAYGHRLIEAGVTVTVKRALGHIHGSMTMTKLIPDASEYHELAYAFLREVSK